MVMIILLGLAFGSPDMTFPLWVWILGFISMCNSGREVVVNIQDARRP